MADTSLIEERLAGIETSLDNLNDILLERENARAWDLYAANYKGPGDERAAAAYADRLLKLRKERFG